MFFKNKSKKKSLSEVKSMIESFFNDMVNSPPDNHRIQGGDKTTFAWQIMRGSAVIFITIMEDDDGDVLFRLTSPIVVMPDENLLPLYRHCLELNFQLVGCSIGIKDSEIVVIHGRYAEGLDQEEINEAITYLSNFSDDLDDKLVAEFGGQLWSEANA